MENNRKLNKHKSNFGTAGIHKHVTNTAFTAFYKKPTGKAEKEWKDLKKNIDRESRTSFKSQTNIHYKLANLHEHWPVFTLTVTIVRNCFALLISYFFLLLNLIL